MLTTEIKSESIFKKIFWITSLIILITLPAMSHRFGQNGDEDVELIYGQDIYNFFFRGDQQALNYDHHALGASIEKMEYYGGMFDFTAAFFHNIIPNSSIIDVRHFLCALFAAGLMIFTGLLAMRITNKNWFIGIVALLCMVFSPRIFGEGMTNGKDIPFATGFLIATYYAMILCTDVTLSKRQQLWKAIGLGIGFFIVTGMRPGGSFLLLGYLGVLFILQLLFNKSFKTHLFENNKLLLKRHALQVGLSIIGAYALSLLWWPYGLMNPISGVWEAFSEMSQRSVNIRTLFNGHYYDSTETPWNYALTWICITSPIIILLMTILSIPTVIIGRKSYRMGNILFLFFAALFPIVYIWIKNATIYDTWRHLFFIYPYWVTLACVTIDYVASKLDSKFRFAPAGILMIGLIPAAFWIFTNTPYQGMYFNSLVGGTKGAYGKYDIDYYHTTNISLAEWALKNIPRPKDGKKIIIASNMDGLVGIPSYFDNDTSWIEHKYVRYYERNQEDWDYYINNGRFISTKQLESKIWLQGDVIHTLEIDGAPTAVIHQRKNKDGVAAFKALSVEKYEEAVTLYESALKVDKTDEMLYYNYAFALFGAGKTDESIKAMETVLTLDNAPEYYQTLANIYRMVGAYEKARAMDLLAEKTIREHLF